MKDILDESRVARNLRTRWLGRAWRHFDEIGSTNDEARAWAESGAPHGAVVVAETQSRGRGRLGRAWSSPRGGLWMSVVLRPPLPPARVAPLSLAVGVAVAEAVEQGCGLRTTLKWPNDVRHDGRKLGGVLAEAAVEGERLRHVIVGIGVNVNAAPPEVPNAASLASLAGRRVPRGAWCASLCGSLETWIDTLFSEGPAPVLAAWRRIGELGHEVRVSTGARTIEGVAVDVDEIGGLIVRLPSGALETISGGEIVP